MNLSPRVSRALVALLLFVVLSSAAAQTALGASAKEIEVSVDVALERFLKEIDGAQELIDASQGILVLPKVIKAGIGIGGEYGEGALRIDGETVDYYNTAAASFGLQFGAQAKDIILIFMQEEALTKFRIAQGWKAGVDGSIALVAVGAGGSIDTTNIKDPIIGFVFGQKGLMYNLTLEGSKFTRLDKGLNAPTTTETSTAGSGDGATGDAAGIDQ